MYHKTIISPFSSVHRQTGTGMFSVGNKKTLTVAASALVGSLFHSCGAAIHRHVHMSDVSMSTCTMYGVSEKNLPLPGPRFSGSISPTAEKF